MTRLRLWPACFAAALAAVCAAWLWGPAQEAKSRRRRKVALLVGPSEYKFGFKTLPHLVDDVKALAEELKAGGFDEVVVLTDAVGGARPATRANVLAQLKRLLDGGGNEVHAVGKADLVLLALSGHGQEVFDKVKTDKKDTFFAPTDGKTGDSGTLLNLNELLNDSLAPTGVRVVVLADMCREIYSPNKGKGVDTDNLRVPRNCAVLFGCESAQESFVNADLKHSLFTYAVLEVLRESRAKGEPLLWSELAAGVERKFASAKYKALMTDGREQSPVQRVTDLRSTVLMSAAEPVADYDLSGGERFAHFGPGGSVRALVEVYDEAAKGDVFFRRLRQGVNDNEVERHEVHVVDPIAGRAVAGPLKHGGRVMHAAFSPDGRRVVTASEDKTAAVWDAATGKRVAGPLEHADGVYHAAFSPDGTRVVTASVDNTATVWDATTGEKIGSATVK